LPWDIYIDGCECYSLANLRRLTEGIKDVFNDPPSIDGLLLRGVSLVRELLRYSRLASRFPELERPKGDTLLFLKSMLSRFI